VVHHHARDWLSDDSPNDTLHRVSGKTVPNFGYPFCHQGDISTRSTARNRSCAEFDKPAQKLGAHIAPLGMKFYNGKMSRPSTRTTSSSRCTARGTAPRSRATT